MSIRIRVLLSIAALIVVGVVGVRRLTAGDPRSGSRGASAPPIAFALPPFTLTDQDARTVTREDLRGHVTIVDFIFTRCPSICPRLTQKMSALAVRAKDDDIRFVSISVDPDNDDPATLRAYGEKFGADFARWTFLTGDQKAVEDAVISGFKVAYAKDPDGTIAHAERFVLVDASATIRGYFDADDASQERLLEAARRLAD